MTLSFEQQKKVKPRLPNGKVIVCGKELKIRDTARNTRTVRATYGIVRVLQLRHVAALKHHYPSTIFRGISLPGGRYRLGNPRLNKGELLALMMQNCLSIMRDSMMMSDVVVFISCSVCNGTVIACDCPNPKPPAIEKQTIRRRGGLRRRETATTATANGCLRTTGRQKRLGTKACSYKTGRSPKGKGKTNGHWRAKATS
jgi:hypothetical protein